MTPKHLLLTALILALAASPGQANLDVSHQVSPDQIWPATSARGPTFGTVTLTVAADGPNETMPIDLVLAIDSSASMKETDPSKKRLDAARSFISKLDPTRDRVGIVSFDDDVDFSIPPTDNFAMIMIAIGRVDSAEGTNLDRGLAESIDLLAADSTPGMDGRARFVVFLSDGDGDYIKSGRKGSQADRAWEEGIVFYTVGLILPDRSKDNLRDIAETTGGRHFDACDASALASIYQAIAEEVINLAGRDVEVRYVLPRELSATDYSVPPSSDGIEVDERVLVWKAGDLPAGEGWSTSFSVSSQIPGIFELGGEGSKVAYKRRSGFEEMVGIEGAFLDVGELRSGASTNLNCEFNYTALKEIVRPVQEVVEEIDSGILWRFSECSSGCAGDWAFISRDGRIAVASLRPFSLSTKDALVEDLQRVMDLMAAAGAEVSGAERAEAIEAAEFYASEAGIYHRLSYPFSADFDLTIFVPDSRIEEARLAVAGSEMDYFAGAADQEYYIDGEYVTVCQFHDFPWNGWCTAEDVEIADKIRPGAHRISGRMVSDPHTMTIEFITAEKPAKDFLLYSDDYRSVWIPATTNALRTSDEMLSIPSGAPG
jgi:Ca-activated chloride channel family protein